MKQLKNPLIIHEQKNKTIEVMKKQIRLLIKKPTIQVLKNSINIFYNINAN